MSRNSKAKRDARKKKERASEDPRAWLRDPKLVQQEITNLFNPKKLTVPSEVDETIRAFCESISPIAPSYLRCAPEPWSRQSCCDMNVAEFIRLHGGGAMCGYKIWYHAPHYIEAERHAVCTLNGELRDVSFNADGEESILFLPDIPEHQSDLESNKQRIRWGRDWKTRKLIEIQESSESMMTVRQMNPQEAWNTMLTYADWLKGARMSNLQPDDR